MALDEQRRGSDRMSRALSTLPPEQREAVVLFELEEFSIEEIAAIQMVSVSAVKSRLARGRERLRRHYERLEFFSRGERPEREIPHVGATPAFGAVPVTGIAKAEGCGNRGAPLPEGETP